jgi:hypothetical protein
MYRITIDMKDVAEGDVTDLAQQIYDDNAEAFDAERGDFVVAVSKDGFAVDWSAGR